MAHEGKAMGVQWYEQARAREVLEKTLKREKRKLETILIANSPATALVEQYCAIANPAVGSPCPGGTDGVVERAISRRGMQYLH